RILDEPGRLPQARDQVPLPAPRAGVVAEVDAWKVALAARRLGAGRTRTEDAVDPAVGISGLVKIGESVKAGNALCVIHANDGEALAAARAMLRDAIVIGEDPVSAPTLIEAAL